MSHSQRDAKGGHNGFNHGVSWGAGGYESAPRGKHFAKRFNRREARREKRRIVSESIQEYYEKNQDDLAGILMRTNDEYQEERMTQYYEDYDPYDYYDDGYGYENRYDDRSFDYDPFFDFDGPFYELENEPSQVEDKPNIFYAVSERQESLTAIRARWGQQLKRGADK